MAMVDYLNYLVNDKRVRELLDRWHWNQKIPPLPRAPTDFLFLGTGSPSEAFCFYDGWLGRLRTVGGQLVSRIPTQGTVKTRLVRTDIEDLLERVDHFKSVSSFVRKSTFLKRFKDARWGDREAAIEASPFKSRLKIASQASRSVRHWLQSRRSLALAAIELDDFARNGPEMFLQLLRAARKFEGKAALSLVLIGGGTLLGFSFCHEMGLKTNVNNDILHTS